MSITINGTTGIAGVDGSAATPSVQGADSNTGIFFPAADTVAVTTGGTERMRVDSSGGISAGSGTTAISFSIGGILRLPAVTTEERAIEIGNGRTGNGYSYIDFVGDTTYSDYGLRIIRENNGANANSTITHRGTGALGLSCTDAAPLIFTTNSTERLRIDSAGQIGIGGANYGTSGQVLTSGGSGAAPSWASRGFASTTITNTSRASATNFQNTTNGTMLVTVVGQNNGASMSSGATTGTMFQVSRQNATYTAVSCMVPPGWYYSATYSVLNSWIEGQ
jgi:hypothetical protein